MAEPTLTASTEPPPKTGHGEFPPFQTETFASQLFWLVIAFVLLYVLMSKIALPRVASIIESRKKKIEDDLAEAGNLKTQSDETMAGYEKALVDAHVRGQAIVNETREKQALEAAAQPQAARGRTQSQDHRIGEYHRRRQTGGHVKRWYHCGGGRPRHRRAADRADARLKFRHYEHF